MLQKIFIEKSCIRSFNPEIERGSDSRRQGQDATPCHPFMKALPRIPGKP
ncbi:hypothetical protein LPW11_04365 [Geomonas sp. RF6]|nr:hypothetical protein [Geomonas sp. RF6]UFS71433.1 hypothetical protein LPW11_04365 [Geomonas sp. RF6]